MTTAGMDSALDETPQTITQTQPDPNPSAVLFAVLTVAAALLLILVTPLLILLPPLSPRQCPPCPRRALLPRPVRNTVQQSTHAIIQQPADAVVRQSVLVRRTLHKSGRSSHDGFGRNSGSSSSACARRVLGPGLRLWPARCCTTAVASAVRAGTVAAIHGEWCYSCCPTSRPLRLHLQYRQVLPTAPSLHATLTPGYSSAFPPAAAAVAAHPPAAARSPSSPALHRLGPAAPSAVRGCNRSKFPLTVPLPLSVPLPRDTLTLFLVATVADPRRHPLQPLHTLTCPRCPLAHTRPSPLPARCRVRDQHQLQPGQQLQPPWG